MRLRFSIRDLLWLTLVVALVTGWWLDRGLLAEKATSATALKAEVLKLQIALEKEQKNSWLNSLTLENTTSAMLQQQVIRLKQELAKARSELLQLQKEPNQGGIRFR